jgi:hypothetical protein
MPSAVQSAFQTLESDLQKSIPSGAQPKYAAVGQVLDDLVAIRKGTLSGSQAQTAIQTDTAAVWTSMGLTSAQITTIQNDQQALQSALQTAFNQSGTTSSQSGTTSSQSGTTSSQSGTTSSQSSTDTNSTSSSSDSAMMTVMQSVGGYLVGIPGLRVFARGGAGFGQDPGGPVLVSGGGPVLVSGGGPVLARGGGS